MSKRLEDQNFYHGIRAVEDIAKELKKPGDFLIRAAQHQNGVEVVLNVLGQDGLCNIVLSIIGEQTPKYCLQSQKVANNHLEFESIVDLVEFYKAWPLPNGLKLKNGVPRPRWLIKHNQIQYEGRGKLGSGNFCDVYKGKYTDNNCRVSTVAIKVCHPDEQMDPQEAQETRLAMLREAKIMSKYSHPHVIEFYGVACDHLPVLLVLELCIGGNLEDHLRRFDAFSPLELVLYIFEVSRGMRYLHAQKCVHRDLATRNCLISANGQIKISDFGLSKLLNDIGVEQKIKNVPIRWLAPECVRRNPTYSLASDVWAFGVLIYEVFNKGIPPWEGDKDFKAMAKRIRTHQMPPFPSNTPEVVLKLVTEKIWLTAEHRITFREIVVVLADYIFENIPRFPKVAELMINKIKGVKRTSLIYGTKQDILCERKSS
ncbi:Tyrosine-protein kinase [Aphelenchoides bicaudatus]|nr:Tyrosine-protein kinase [Aphelenchoides bicaudatus]